MTGFTACAFLCRNRVSPTEAFEGLELCEGKLSCTVLRGLDGSNPVRLLGDSGITDRRALIRDLPIEGVDFLGAGVAEQKRRVVGGQAEPDIVETCLPEVFQVGHSLDLVIA